MQNRQTKFCTGCFAAVSNSITGVVVGGLLVLAYTQDHCKKRFSGSGIRWLLKRKSLSHIAVLACEKAFSIAFVIYCSIKFEVFK